MEGDEVGFFFCTDDGSPCVGRLVTPAAIPTPPLPLNSGAADQQGANGIKNGGRCPLSAPPSDASTLGNPASSCVAAYGDSPVMHHMTGAASPPPCSGLSSGEEDESISERAGARRETLKGGGSPGQAGWHEPFIQHAKRKAEPSDREGQACKVARHSNAQKVWGQIITNE